MYQFALLVGLYSYTIFTLGIFHGLTGINLFYISIIYLGVLTTLVKKNWDLSFKNLRSWFKSISKTEWLFISFILVQALVNFIGVLGPELAFDSLWYHLTLPKIYLITQFVQHINGGILYYSDMPKLIEMLYIPAIATGIDLLPKMIHFLFGIGTLYVLYRLSRQFLNRQLSLLVLVIFYSNLVVAWLSITSYVDLARAFFVTLAIYYFVIFLKSKKDKLLIISSLMLGFAIASKLLSVLDILIFIGLIFVFLRSLKKISLFVFVSLIIPLPWLIFSYLNTGNPIYPFMSGVIQINTFPSLNNIFAFIHSSDPISPIYIIVFPLVFFVYKKFKRSESAVLLFSLFAFIIWFLTAQIGGGRFAVAYLPTLSLLSVITLSHLNQRYKKVVIFAIIFIALISIIYRGFANLRYVPVVLGLQTKNEFLSKNLNFSFGDFYDTDGYFKANIKSSDRVLIYGIHNLYYVDFPYIHESWLRPSDFYNYVLVRGDSPEVVKNLKMVYENPITHVKLYKK